MADQLLPLIGDLPYKVARVVELLVQSAEQTPAAQRKSFEQARDMLDSALGSQPEPKKRGRKPKASPADTPQEIEEVPTKPTPKPKKKTKVKPKKKTVSPDDVDSGFDLDDDDDEDEPDFSDLDEDLDDAGL